MRMNSCIDVKESRCFMSVKIKISYEYDQELQELIKLLSPKIKRYKKADKQADKQGKYNRVYIEVK